MQRLKHFFSGKKAGIAPKVAALALLCGFAINAQAALCTQASSANTAYTAINPGRSTNLAAVNSVCWLNIPSLTGTTVQNLTYTLKDGSVVKLTVQKTAGQDLTATAPAWSGSAMFNAGTSTSYGSYWPDTGSTPVLYYSAHSTTETTVDITAVSVTNSNGAAVPFRMVIADAESTNKSGSGTETFSATINSALSGGTGTWATLDTVNSVANSPVATVGPTLTGASTATFTLTGTGTANPGSYLMWTDRPQSITVTLNAPNNGKQGLAVGIQMGSVVVTKTITPSRADASDQFTYTASVNNSPVSQTTSASNPGTNAAALGGLLPTDVITVSESMAAGASALSNYIRTFECKTTTGTTVAGTSLGHTLPYANLQLPDYGNNINCVITNKAPTLKVVKSVVPSTDAGQFTYTLSNGYTGFTPTPVTGGNGTTASVVTGVGKSPTFNEAASGPTVLANYETSVTCKGDTTGNAVPFTGNPAAGGTVTITSMPAEDVTCTLVNKRLSKADLSVTKTGPAVVVSGKTVTYALAVRNSNTVVGASAVSGATLTDAALAGAPYASGSVTIACDTTVTGNVCTAGSIPTVAQLQSGYSIPVTIPVGGVYALSITATVN